MARIFSELLWSPRAGDDISAGVVHKQIHEFHVSLDLVIKGKFTPSGRYADSSAPRLTMVKMCREQIAFLHKRSPSEEENIRTVFDINFHPNLEKGQFTPTFDEMVGDALGYMMAGTDTVSHTMAVITWALLKDPQMMQKLKAELTTVMPGREDTVEWAKLENLSYLVSQEFKKILTSPQNQS